MWLSGPAVAAAVKCRRLLDGLALAALAHRSLSALPSGIAQSHLHHHKHRLREDQPPVVPDLALCHAGAQGLAERPVVAVDILRAGLRDAGLGVTGNSEPCSRRTVANKGADDIGLCRCWDGERCDDSQDECAHA